MKIYTQFNVPSAYAAVALPLAFKELSGIPTKILGNLGVHQLKNATFLRGGWLIGVTGDSHIGVSFTWQDHRGMNKGMISSYSDMCLLLGVGNAIQIKLNDNYTAEISADKKEVKVGCQSFSAYKIAEVYNALRS